MSRDYARKERPTRSSATPRKSSSGGSRAKARPRTPAPARRQGGGLSLKWILSLAAVGGFIGFIVYLNSLPAGSPGPAATTVVEKTAPKAPEAKKEPEKKQEFRFYEMLPDSEVVPPKVDEYSPPKSMTEYDYVVQSGSFRHREDAERQRAQIAFQGLRASIQRIDLESGSVWYRVNVGPFTSRSEMNAAVDKLVSLNISPLIRKIPKKEG
ncbi:SPOR domain-containing protein [Marinobacter koreensis]|uniref:SPOR domain-containing protein n=1 Tax=Marinobacter koreensis TaxID=335974 RepID=A0ABW0RM38_9GAMM|nr:SPOR domain-containing protein [Marinobacter koreensis]MCK7549797.1 SPOR domain-containing protein [Marinobacter koreensis]